MGFFNDVSVALVPASSGGEVLYPFGSHFVHGMVWHRFDASGAAGATAAPDLYKINGGRRFVDRMSPGNMHILARPSSAHSGGVNGGFADGSTRFISDEIDYRVYQALLTPKGKASDVPFNEYVLRDDAL